VSWQARCVAAAIRVAMRRAHWGEPARLARRARRLFGAPNPLVWLRTRGVRIEPVHDDAVRGEWLSAGPADQGAILYLHGGGYVAGSPVTHRPITAALARLAARRVFALEYRLAPEHRFPAALDDAVAGYRWLLEQGIAPSSLAVAGDSAGGGLGLALLVRARDEGLPRPACAVCFSPWTDLAATGESLLTNNGRCAMFRPENVADFARVYLGDASPRHPHASPLFADLRGLPPLLVQVGSGEILLDDARRLHEKIRMAGGLSTLQVFDAVFHVWQMLDGFIPESRQALQDAAAFMNRREGTSRG
jgi:epsilon-lactone hydrolase